MQPAAPAAGIEKRAPVRKPLPAHLPRETVRHEPDSSCPDCGSSMNVIGEDIAEMLEFVPSHFKVLRHVRPRLACRCCERIVQMPAPSRPIDRGIPGPGLLAHVLVSKYADHLPLHRQAGIYAREGVEIDRSTLADWVGSAARLLDPLVQALARHVLAADKLHADDTPVPVLQPGRGTTKTGRLWTYVRDDRPAGGEVPPAVWFRYSPDRKGIRPVEHLKPFTGILQADGYAGFDRLYDTGRIIEAACWAHYLERSFIWASTRAAACRRRWLSRRSLHIIPSRARLSAGAARSTLADSVAHEFRRGGVRRGPRVEDGDDIEVPVARSRRLRLCASRQLRTRQASRRSRGSLVLPAGAPHLQLVA